MSNLADLLKQRLDAVIHKHRQAGLFNVQTEVSLQIEVNKALDEGLKANPAPGYEKIDAFDFVIGVLKEHEKALDGAINKLEELASGYGEMVEGKATGTRVKVGSQSRIVLKEFNPGTYLHIRWLFRKDAPEVLRGALLEME